MQLHVLLAPSAIQSIELWGKNISSNDEKKIFELLDEYLHDLKIYGLEVRIEELESKFSKDLSETTFNEIKDLKEQKKKQNVN